MATKYGVEATKIYNQEPKEAVSVGSLGGNIRVHYDTYELSADLSANDIILMNGLLPKGALLLDAAVLFDDLDASGGTIDFGYAASADAAESADENAFIEAADVTSANVVWASDNQATPACFGKRLTAAVQPQVKIEGDTDATTGTIRTFIMYALD